MEITFRIIHNHLLIISDNRVLVIVKRLLKQSFIMYALITDSNMLFMSITLF